MKMIKKLFTALMAISICLTTVCSFATVNAAVIDNGEIISPSNIAVTTTYHSLEKISGELSCYAETNVQQGYKSGVVVELQRRDSVWTTVKTWSDTGNYYALVDETYKPASGYYYRLKITFKAYDSSWNQVESIVKYSEVVYY